MPFAFLARLTIILNWRLHCSSRPQQLFIDPWSFSDPHSTTWLFVDPLDGPIDLWGSISTTLRTTELEVCVLEDLWLIVELHFTTDEIAVDLWRVPGLVQQAGSELYVCFSFNSVHCRREDLIGYLCGRSPPHRSSKPSSSLSKSQDGSRDNRMQMFHDAVSMNGAYQFCFLTRKSINVTFVLYKALCSFACLWCGHIANTAFWLRVPDTGNQL